MKVKIMNIISLTKTSKLKSRKLIEISTGNIFPGRGDDPATLQ